MHKNVSECKNKNILHIHVIATYHYWILKWLEIHWLRLAGSNYFHYIYINQNFHIFKDYWQFKKLFLCKTFEVICWFKLIYIFIFASEWKWSNGAYWAHASKTDISETRREHELKQYMKTEKSDSGSQQKHSSYSFILLLYTASYHS